MSALETFQSEPSPVADFDTWRKAINIMVLKGYDAYKATGLRDQEKTLSKKFDQWLKTDLPKHGLSAERQHDVALALSFGHDICSGAWRGAFSHWVLHSEAFERLITEARNSPDFTYHHFIADMCQAYGEALATKGASAVISPYHSASAPDHVQYKTRGSDGSWMNISADELLRLMRDPSGPHVLFSANHAFLDVEKDDLSMLNDSLGKLYTEASRRVHHHDEKGQPMYREPHARITPWDQASFSSGETVMVFATHTCPNRFLNLAQLFYRLDEIERHGEKASNDRFQHAAPITVQTVTMMLQSIMEDRDVARIRYQKDALGRPSFVDLSGGPVHVRADAPDILRRQLYRAFSQGGNAFHDSLRLLTHALAAQGLDRKPLIALPCGMRSPDLLESISEVAFGLNEAPMAKYYSDAGVGSILATNKRDSIAPHAVASGKQGISYNLKGDDNANGHTPDILVKAILGDPFARARVRSADAASYGCPAIMGVEPISAPGWVNAHSLQLTLSPGTTDATANTLQTTLEKELQERGLSIKLERKPGTASSQRYVLSSMLEDHPLISAEALGILKEVLAQLQSRGELSVTEEAMEMLSVIRGAWTAQHMPGTAQQMPVAERLKSIEHAPHTSDQLRAVRNLPAGAKPHGRISRVSPKRGDKPDGLDATPTVDKSGPSR